MNDLICLFFPYLFSFLNYFFFFPFLVCFLAASFFPLSCLFSRSFISQCFIYTRSTVLFFTASKNTYQIDKFNCILIWTEITLLFLYSFRLNDYTEGLKKNYDTLYKTSDLERIVIEL